MKTKKTIIYSFIASFLISFAFYSCTNDDPGNIQHGEVEFGFDLKEISTNKSIQADFGDPSAIVLSIEDASGTLVYDTEEVELYNMNGAFVSKPLSLLVGDYKLVTFLVIDADANVIYASPLVGSNMAYLVNTPVPINFTVNKDQTIKLIPEVLSTEDVTPEDFGYTTFGFDVVETFDFLISVFAYNETSENFELTEAILSVYADDNPIFRDSLPAITNQVKVNDGFDPYVVEVRKDGYDTYLDTISNAELKLYFDSEDNGPLIVILENGTLVMGEPCPQTPTLTDVDGNVYSTVQIGNQCWMASNLKVTKFNDDTAIPNVTQVSEWNNLATPAYAWYDNDLTNKDIYGALYNWHTVNTNILCPAGWHVPSITEWIELSDYLDGESLAGGKLKEEGTTHWNAPNYGATNETNFSALPGGARFYAGGDFARQGRDGLYWSSTNYNWQSGEMSVIFYDQSIIRHTHLNKKSGLSVRCIKN